MLTIAVPLCRVPQACDPGRCYLLQGPDPDGQAEWNRWGLPPNTKVFGCQSWGINGSTPISRWFPMKPPIKYV